MAVGGEKAAAARIEGRIVFEHGNRGFDGVNGRSTARKEGVASFEGVANAVLVGGFGVCGDGPAPP